MAKALEDSGRSGSVLGSWSWSRRGRVLRNEQLRRTTIGCVDCVDCIDCVEWIECVASIGSIGSIEHIAISISIAAAQRSGWSAHIRSGLTLELQGGEVGDGGGDGMGMRMRTGMDIHIGIRLGTGMGMGVCMGMGMGLRMRMRLRMGLHSATAR